MAQTLPRPQLLKLIAEQEAEALRLSAVAKRDVMKDHIRLATRDLDEALTWLRKDEASLRPQILTIASLAVAMATQRLTMVKEALDKYGPNAMSIG